ncbi:MAG: hypothetical protein M3Q44_04585 [bacterium]|nr:hypothetical protein [bacterium]
MIKEPIEKIYKELYQLDEHQIKTKNYALYFDTLKKGSFDNKKPTYLFDVDHTLLNINELKDRFNEAFAKYNKVFSPDVWQATYKEAKSRENFYDFSLHIAILSKKIDGKAKTKSELINLMQKTILEIIPDIIHPNLFWQINAEKDHINLVLATAGDTTYHRMKVEALIAYLPVLPQTIIYIEKTDKGDVVNELYKHFRLPDDHEIYVFDDNPSELEDIHQKCPRKKIHLIRVRQPNGHYNHKIAANLIRSEEWNFINQS